MDEQCGVVPRGFLCCRLCEEEFRHPKLLPCLHSFCKDCLEGHVQKHSDEDGYFGCPVCGTETTLKQQKVEKLPDNLFARRLSNPVISLVKPPKKDKTCRNCRQNGQRSDIAFHCINCDDFLCNNCAAAHTEQEETASHSTESIQEYEEQNKTPQNSPEAEDTPSVLSQCCEYYDAFDIGAMFCVDCDTAICADCQQKKHQQHRCAELTAVSHNFETKIKPPLEELANDAKSLKKTLKELELAEKVLLKQQTRLQTDVKKRTKILCSMITDYENVLLSEIDRRHSHSLEFIQQKRSDIDLHLASIQAVTDLTEKLVSYGSEEEKVSMRKKIGRRVRELCETELPTSPREIHSVYLSEPEVNVEKICDLYGDLKTGGLSCSRRSSRSQAPSVHSQDSKTSVSECGDAETEITELDDLETFDQDMLSASNTSETFRAIQEEPEEQEHDQTNSSFQSSSQEEVPSFNLDEPIKELPLPANIQKDCVKGMGVNPNGDLIIGAGTAGNHTVYCIEKRGIIRGQIPIEKGWNIHSVAPDGKIALTITRGDNRYKVKVLSNDGCGTVLADLHLESFGLNYVTAFSCGQVLISSSRYAQLNRNYGKAAKSGGNVAIYNKEGQITMRITNEDFVNEGLHLFEKPQSIAVDSMENFFVCDPSTHTVCGFDKDGTLLFQHGNTDSEGEIYQGPDSVCVDKFGNIIITDKREGRIDILTYQGQLQKCFFFDDNIKYVSTSPDKLLVLGTTDCTVKFFEYL